MNKQELAARYPWIDPTLGYPNDTLIEGVRKTDYKGYLVVKHGGPHKSIDWVTVYHAEGLEKIDGHDWELYNPYYENDEYYWGMPVLGLGLMNVMIPKEFARDMTDVEKAAWSRKKLVMVGSHTGKPSYGMEMPEM